MHPARERQRPQSAGTIVSRPSLTSILMRWPIVKPASLSQRPHRHTTSRLPVAVTLEKQPAGRRHHTIRRPLVRLATPNRLTRHRVPRLQESDEAAPRIGRRRRAHVEADQRVSAFTSSLPSLLTCALMAAAKAAYRWQNFLGESTCDRSR